jgi:predicted nuclease with TOPRIM domain
MDIEERLRNARQRRERLVQDKAAKQARYDAACDKLQKIKDKAATSGFKVEDLPQIIADKEADIEAKMKQCEIQLEEAEQAFSKYKD